MKNYLRKVYDKLGVADRLELALYCLNNRVVERGIVTPPVPAHTSPGNGAALAASAGSPQNPGKVS